MLREEQNELVMGFGPNARKKGSVHIIDNILGFQATEDR